MELSAELLKRLPKIKQIELAENLVRKDFSQAEIAQMQKELIEEFNKIKEPGKRTDLTSDACAAQVNRVADLVGSIFRESGDTVTRRLKIAEKAPGKLAKVDARETTIYQEFKQVQADIRASERENERDELIKQVKEMPPNERWHIEVGDIRTFKTDIGFDFIITDPPYPKEYLPLYESLAILANRHLKPEGLLLVMCGQSYLDTIITTMSKHIRYYWIGCYLMPGSPTPLRTRQVNTNWKPILIFGNHNYSGKTFGDVWTSEKPDKDFNEWGQSVSGMLSLIKQVCLPGQIIMDPFCGAGTTGVAALIHGCRFFGIDINSKCVDISKVRLSEVNRDT